MKTRQLVIFCILIFAAILASCGGSANNGNTGNNDGANQSGEDMGNSAGDNGGDAGGNYGAGESPGSQATPESNPFPVIYGVDGRREACKNCSSDIAHPDSVMQALSGSVAILVHPDTLYQEVFGEKIRLFGYSLEQRVELLYGAPLCGGERFSDQIAPGFCSGFLIDDHTLLTAEHCVSDAAACENTRIIFNYQIGSDGQPEPILSEDIFTCESVEVVPEVDLALVTLDRAAGVPPLVVTSTEDLQLGSPLGVIGHPSGLPKKISTDGFVLQRSEGSPYFIGVMDTFAGSSGSPVFDLESYQVVGVLVGGESDYDLTQNSCFAVKLCQTSAEDCTGELIVSISELIGR